MGGKKGALNKPLGSIGDKVLGKNSIVNRALNVASNLMLSASGGAGTADEAVRVGTNAVRTAGQAVQDVGRNVGEAFGEVTGANAAREQAMKEAEAGRREAKRQADISDALARNQGGDPTNIFLATGKKRGGGGRGSTGSSGTGSSRNTGIQT